MKRFLSNQLSDIIYFLPSSNQSSTKLVWSSEKLGNRHLFLVTVANEKPCHTKDNSNNKIKDTGNHLHICDVLSNAELTEGPWEVSTSKVKNQPLIISVRGFEDLSFSVGFVYLLSILLQKLSCRCNAIFLST